MQKRFNKYRVQKQIDGKRYSFTFDHKPTQKEIKQKLEEVDKSIKQGNTFAGCARSYIDSKSNVLSPATIRGYEQLARYVSDDLSSMDIGFITQVDVQKEVNKYARNHAPKTTRNFSSFICTVIKFYRDDVTLNIKLPQKEKKDLYIPTDEDIKVITNAALDTEYYIPIMLACYGLRRSEICALTIDDLEGNKLTINKAKVQDKNKNWVIKQTTKTEASTRVIYLDQRLSDYIREKGYIYEGYPNSIYRWLKTTQAKNGIQHFALHKLRHYFASKLSSENIPEVDILALGGWQTANVMKEVYRHSMMNEKKQKNTLDKLSLFE